jgi:nucleoside-diphosphate-sugar epimerase
VELAALVALRETRRDADERPHRAKYTFVRRAARGRRAEAMARVLIAGCGYVGCALGAALVADGDVVFGLRRRIVSLPAGVQPIEADLAVPKTLRDLPGDLDFVVYAASPGGPDDALYRTAYVEGLGRLLEALAAKQQRLRRVFLLSSTSVYGQERGEWVDESTPPAPLDFRGKRILEAEALLAASGRAATVVRLGGIYGPQRARLIERVRSGQAVYPRGAPRFTNRIHRDDCAGALRHLMRLPAPESLYLGVDCEPADEATVLRWLAGALGAPEPRAAQVQSERGSKRCRNDRLLASGYAFRFPTFREGYAALLAQVR